VNASPVPTQTILAFEGATVTSPIVSLLCASNTGSNVVPLLVVFHTPPVQNDT
jgi:hypothetical protein